MVTSTKAADDKAVAVNADAGVVASPPPRTLLEDVNAHLTCVLCKGYYIDATTIVECLHSFCRSCIVKHLQVKKYCPVCEMMINAAKPNIKADKALQDIVYKLVPGLFQREMERRRQFYSSRPGPAAATTPEQRGEDTERIIFSPEDVISFSLEYTEVTDSESVSSRSSESGNEAPSAAQQTRRFLQCPAVVNISHLKKFISMKFDIDCTQFCIDILYKRVPLLDYYTLMDIAYIYNWKRNEPLRFFYQIIDYSAIRSRFGRFDINRKNSQFRSRKRSTNTEDTNASSPAAPLNDHSSEGTSGTNSPMPEDFNSSTHSKNTIDKSVKKLEKSLSVEAMKSESSDKCSPEDDVEKSQFLNSFELTAKNSSSQNTSPSKPDAPPVNAAILKKDDHTPKKVPPVSQVPDANATAATLPPPNKLPTPVPQPVNPNPTELTKTLPKPAGAPDTALKRTYPSANNSISPKRKCTNDSVPANQQTAPAHPSPVKLQSHPERNSPAQKSDPPKHLKKVPDLKANPVNPNISRSHKQQLPMNAGIRTDLLANNSDPIQDRSKILSQVKKSLNIQNSSEKMSGDPLKSLFDSCKINIPSSLSITLTDQKTDPRNESNANDAVKPAIKNSPQNASGTFGNMKSPTPAVQNSIEILKLPDVDAAKSTRAETANSPSTAQPTKPSDSSTTTTAKGPVPSLKPISDTKIGKQSTFTKPAPTFHQIFIQSLQSQQPDKPKVQKSKAPVPKLMPANPKPNSDTVRSEPSQANPNKIPPEKAPPTTKSDSVLDLSAPSQLGPHQTKLLETMQSIANLAAKKHNFPQKQNIPNALTFPNSNKLAANPSAPLRIPSQSNQNKPKLNNPASPSATATARLDAQSNKSQFFRSALNTNTSSPSAMNQQPQHAASPAHSSPRSQTRSPSVSPKLVIAEEKQTPLNSDGNQSNQISSSQISSTNSNKIDGGTQPPTGQLKQIKNVKQQLPQSNKLTNMRLPNVASKSTSSGHPIASGADMFHSLTPQILAQQQALQQLQARQHSDMQAMGHIHPITADWINKLNQARLENLYKSLSNVQQAQNDYNGKDNTKK